ncbi:MAG: UDP-N-acetylmuramoyl-tripeptide--D-alanyl-D-alanine ligase [Bacteroidales bacterium]|nr:UDP-N-acetylmuramoyl-tripeptide--D-alanyl-D-alanine ligase [Bacteroidales bacterium]
MKKKLIDIYKLFIKHPLISTDSRNIQKYSIFFSLKGDNFNGNEFAETAIENGASFAIIDEVRYKKNTQYIVVDDVLKTLQELAKYHRKQLNTQIIAITGTNGKTTTKELICDVLKKKYKTQATQGNLNNHIGVPLTILSLKKETEIAVIEMGANHEGEIAKLCEIAQPDFGIITNIGKAHLEGFRNITGIIKAKNELYNYISNKNGTVFVNIDNNLLSGLSENIKKITYGTSTKANCCGNIIEIAPFIKLHYKCGKNSNMIQSQLIGNYNLENILAAVCTGNYFNVEHKNIKNAIENYLPANNRSQILKTSDNFIILDAYNANPTSMEAAINNFALMNYKNKIVILGDMLELGSESINEHQKIIELLEKQNFNKIILVGNIFSSISNKNNYTIFSDTEKTLKCLIDNPIKNASVLIKGSRGIKLETLVEFL